MSIARLAARLKIAGFSPLSMQFATQIPGTPFSVRGETKEERLPGMHRWVNRRLLERAMDAQSAGVPEEQFVNQSAHEGMSTNALLGGALGTAAGYHLATKYPDNAIIQGLGSKGLSAPLTTALLGTLVGAGVGAGYNHATAGRRMQDAREAYLGARIDAGKNPRPITALPQHRQDEGSAAATTPVLLHTSPGLF